MLVRALSRLVMGNRGTMGQKKAPYGSLSVENVL